MTPGVAANLKTGNFAIFGGISGSQDELAVVGKNQQILFHHDGRGVILFIRLAEAGLGPLEFAGSGIDADVIALHALRVEVAVDFHGRSEVDLELFVNPCIAGFEAGARIAGDSFANEPDGLGVDSHSIAKDYRRSGVALCVGFEWDPPEKMSIVGSNGEQGVRAEGENLFGASEGRGDKGRISRFVVL